MFKRIYPQAIVLRKNIIMYVILVVGVVVGLIMYNMYKATHPAIISENKGGGELKQVAMQSDTKWFQNSPVNKTNNKIELAEEPVETHVQINEIVRQENTQAQMQKNQQEQQDKQELARAMSASINSNQLSSQSQVANAENASSAGATPKAIPEVGGESDQNMQAEKKAFVKVNSERSNGDYLNETLKSVISPFELKAGTIIPGVLITGINSDLPGQITGQVRSPVYDTVSGKYLLVPQGSKLIGIYDSQVAYGQERVLVVWKRIIFPNGQSINLEGMPGIDMSGYSGFSDQVNNHYVKTFGSVILLSVLSAGAQLSQPQNVHRSDDNPTINQTLAESLGTNLANTGTKLTTKNIDIQPTLEIRPGYIFNISVTKDMVFPGQYNEAKG